MQQVIMPSRAAELDRTMIDTYGIPGLVLMEQAAAAVADEAEKLAHNGKILVLCGKGNNGGDGWAAARILMMRGYDVKIGTVTTEYSGDAAANFRYFQTTKQYELLEENTSFFEKHADASVIIDGLFGTGLSREPSGLYGELIEKINAHPAAVVAVDIPSGVFGADGFAKTAVRADVTVTFQYPKPGHYLFPGRELTGKLIIAPIGLCPDPRSPIAHADRCALPPRSANTNKGTYGRLLIAAGSKGMSGAAVLCTRAAIAAGTGLTYALCTAATANVLQLTVPEAIVHPGGEDVYSVDPAALPKFTALAIGPGLGKTPDIYTLLTQLLPLSAPKVVDADALNVMAEHTELFDLAKNVVYTPHPAEFSRMTGMRTEAILRDPLKAAMEFAEVHQCVVLLKGATTVVADEKRAVLVTAGSPGMAKGGSGDVLTGVLGSLLAQGMDPFEAAYHAAYFCGKAGERAYEARGISMSPQDTINHLEFR